MCRNLLHLLFESLDSRVHCRATHCSSTAPIGTTPFRCGICISVQNHNIFYRNLKLLSSDLGKRRFFALTMRRRAGIDHHRAALLDTHTRTFVETNRQASLGAKPADLNIGGETNAHQLAITRGTPSGLFSTQALVIYQFKRLVQRTLIVAGIIDRPGSRLIGELIWLDEVNPAHLSRILADFTRYQVHDSLDNIGRFRSTGSTIGIRRSLIREDDIAAEM